MISKEDEKLWATEIHRALAPLVPQVRLDDYERWIEFCVTTPKGDLIKRRAKIDNTPARANLIAQLSGLRKLLKKKEGIEFGPWELPRDRI